MELLNEYFCSASMDSMDWLDNAENNRISAKILLEKLKELISPFENGEKDFQNEKEVIAIWNSYYLMTGHSFENLIKGLSIEKNRHLDNFNSVFGTLWKDYSSGHGISLIAKDNIDNLSPGEINILEKLEVFIVWAGKFSLPKNVRKLIEGKGKVIYDSADFINMDNLYNRIKKILEFEWEKNEKEL